MDKSELNKKSLKELRGELLTNRNKPYRRNEKEQEKYEDTIDRNVVQDNEEHDEEDMGMGM